MPPPFLGAPFRAFPSQRSWSPLEATSSLVVVHPRAERTAPSLIATGFPDAHTLRRACLVSPAAMGSPFHEPKPASRSPWTQNSEVAHSARFTHLEAFLPLRIRSRRLELPRPNAPLLS
jgi:hypothetical protein